MLANSLRQTSVDRPDRLLKQVLMVMGSVKGGHEFDRRMDKQRSAKFRIGQVVKHRIYPFRGVIFDVDPIFANTQEWWESIPEEIRPRKDQPFYHLLAENAETEYVAYVSEQNLLPDDSGLPLRHAQVKDVFVEGDDGSLIARQTIMH
jgi:heat shock protein HspQ